METTKGMWYGHMGNGYVVCRSGNECKQIAFIPSNRKLKFYDNNIPDAWRKNIIEMATSGNGVMTNGGGFDRDQHGYLVLSPLNKPTLFAVNHCMRHIYLLSVENVNGQELVCLGHQVFKKEIGNERDYWAKRWRAARPDEYTPITDDAIREWTDKGYTIFRQWD